MRASIIPEVQYVLFIKRKACNHIFVLIMCMCLFYFGPKGKAI